MIRDARKQGLKAPILLMGYYNPLLSYGEENLLRDCKAASVNGFIVVDLPPEEAVSFRKLCTKGGYESPLPLQPSTPHAVPGPFPHTAPCLSVPNAVIPDWLTVLTVSLTSRSSPLPLLTPACASSAS